MEEEIPYPRKNCLCINPTLIDESILGMGIRCIKCGLNAQDRVDEYTYRLGLEKN